MARRSNSSQTGANLPKGQDGQPIQVLRPDEDSVAQATIGATQQRITFPANSDIIEVTVTADSRVRIGGSGVVADGNSRALLRGTYVYMTDIYDTHISVIQLTGADTGFCTVARLQ